MDFEVGAGEVLHTFQVGNLTSGGVPIEISQFKWSTPLDPSCLVNAHDFHSPYPVVCIMGLSVINLLSPNLIQYNPDHVMTS